MVLFCQIISVTITHFKYETVIDMKVIPKGGQRPTFSFFAKNKDKFPQKIEPNLMEGSIIHLELTLLQG